jgi:hypothetical protein
MVDAMFNPFLFVLALMALIFSIPLVAIITEHRRKLAELRLKARAAPEDQTLAKIQDLTRQIADLRSTAMEFDLSFDAALERLESRMGHLENRMQSMERRAGVEPEQKAEAANVSA